VATSAAGPKVPYTDRAVAGSIGLCNRAGQQVTSGSITARPFAWRAVSTQPAPAPYDDAGRTATLYAYQPRRGLTAAAWSGTVLTASSQYSNPAHPMAAATASDESLRDFLAIFKPQWNGLLQLRLYLGTNDAPPYTAHYPALTIKVTGQRWQAVDSRPVDCTSGTATSLEAIAQSTPSGQGASPRPVSKGNRT